RTQADPASRAIDYLQAQQLADGSIPSSAGSYGPTELFVIAAAADGFDPGALRSSAGHSPIEFLSANVVDASSTAGKCGELLQAVLSAGLDPHAFAGHDLVATLAADLNPTTGAYGNGQSDAQAFPQALAMQGLADAGMTVPPAATAYEITRQDSDGGWNYLNIRDDPNPQDFASSDTNSTAMVLMALDASGDHSRDASALTWLHTQQNADGGFPYQAGAPSDPDSTALVAQAILATGGDPAASSWAKSGHTPLQELVATQTAGGGYTFPGNAAPDAFTTSQVPAALLRQPLPAASAFAAGLTPGVEQHAALQALLYLQTQQAGDGSFTGVTATYDPSELYAIGAAAGGYDPRTLRVAGGTPVMDFLAAHVTAATANAGQTGRLIQAVIAAGLDPHSFGGTDLVSRLQSFLAPTGDIYGDGAAFTQTLAIQGLLVAGTTPPPAAVGHLVTTQDSDGGWDYLLKRDDTNLQDFASSDTNSTAMVLMALDAAGNHSRDASALAWLRTQQNTDRGFPYQAGAASDPDSTALVIQAIEGGGGNAAAAPWSGGGRSPFSALVAMQNASGGYAFPGNPAPDVFTTAQVPAALARVAFPVPFAQRAFYQPGATLGAPAAPTPTPSSNTSLSAGPIAPPAPAPARHAASAQSTSNATPPPAPATQPPAAPSPSSGIGAATAPSTTRPLPTRVAVAQPGGPLPLLYAGIALAVAAAVTGAGLLWTRRR
ncbi:MAG: hypothetical protein JOZ46_01925, partial [Candidatus Dormibacteraeota bacterium]|nr:hypothetical protein [Candidatus Dormibacteraeota bacterium]